MMSALFRRFSFQRALRYTLSYAKRKVLRTDAALRAWSSREHNPFLQRDLRVALRKKRPFYTICGLMTAILLVNGGLWWFWNILHDQFPQGFTPFGERYLLPGALGGDVLGGVAIFTLACCMISISLTCGTRAAQLLRDELLGGTLEQLQLLPQREERWLWMMRAHKMALALLIFACGLPVFLLVVFTGHWSLADIFGLLLLAITMGHTAPIWMPMQWQAKQNQRRFDVKAWQEAMKLSQRENAELAKSSVAGQLEAQRRLGKIWENMDSAGAPGDEKSEKEDKKAAKGGFFGGGAQNNAGRSGGNGWLIFVGFQLLNPVFQLMVRIPGNPLSVLWSNFKDALPSDVLTLAPGFLVTWPLLIEKTLRAPMPFFSFLLPPLVICAPLWLARQYQGNMMLAANVSLGETFWNERRVRKRKAAATFSSLCLFFLVFGYGWQTMITDATLAGILRNALKTPPIPLTPQWSLAAFWTLLVIIGTVAGGAAQEAPFKRAQDGFLSAAQALKQSFLVMPRAFAVIVAGYFACCWLGAQSGVEAPFWQRVVPTALTAIAFWLADFSAGALLVALPESRRGAWRVLRFLWFYGLVLAALTHIAYEAFHSRTFGFEQAPYVMFSPYVTLLALLRAQPDLGVPWWPGVAAQLVMAAFCFAIAARKIYGEAPRTVAEIAPEAMGWPLPLRWLGNTLLGIWNGVAAFFKGIAEFSRRAEEGVAQWSARWGNPVIHDEVKRRVRREHWPAVWLLIPLTAAFFWWQIEWFDSSGAGPRPEVAILTLVFAAFAVFFSALRLGSSFDRDRANGSLVFLFLTPLTEKEIAIGKLAASLIFSFGLLLGTLPFLVLTTLLQWLSGDFLLPFYWLMALIFIFTALIYFSLANLMCAVLARTPTTGTSNGFVLCVFSQILLVGAPLFASWIYEKFTGAYYWRGDSTYALLALWLWAMNIVLSFVFWRRTLSALRKQRYSDDVVRGKGAA